MNKNTAKRPRTEVLDDSTAVAIGQPKRKKAKCNQENDLKSKIIKSTPTHSQTTASGPSRSNIEVRNAASKERQDGDVHFPSNNGNLKRTKAHTLKELRKKGHYILLNIVKDHAGEAKRAEMKKMSKGKIIEWILAAESQAVDPKVKKDNNNAKTSVEQASIKRANDASTGRTVDTLALPVDRLQTKSNSRQRATSKASNSNNQTATSTSIGRSANTSNHKRKREQQSNKSSRKHKIPRTANNSTFRKIDFDYEEAERRADALRKLERDSDSDGDNSEDNDSESEGETFSAAHAIEEQPRLDANMPLHRLMLHPIIADLDLNPNDVFHNTKVVHSSERKEVVIVTATTPTSVFQTTISESLLGRTSGPTNDTPASRPFLKAGKHGWDYERHRWGFEGDPDLASGVGHQVLLEDLELLAKGLTGAEAEFRSKYPGRLANQWPCGCHIPWNDEDSEDESI